MPSMTKDAPAKAKRARGVARIGSACMTDARRRSTRGKKVNAGAKARTLSIVPSVGVIDAPDAQVTPTTAPAKTAKTSRTKRHRRQPGEERRKGLSPDSINREAWCAWIETHLRVDRETEGTYLFNGLPLGESDGRALYRWRIEDVVPSFWRVDAWCCRYSLHINQFLRWCEEPRKGLSGGKKPRFCAWALGQPPVWEAMELTGQDIAEIEAAWPEEETHEDLEELMLAA